MSYLSGSVGKKLTSKAFRLLFSFVSLSWTSHLPSWHPHDTQDARTHTVPYAHTHPVKCVHHTELIVSLRDKWGRLLSSLANVEVSSTMPALKGMKTSCPARQREVRWTKTVQKDGGRQHLKNTPRLLSYNQLENKPKSPPVSPSLCFYIKGSFLWGIQFRFLN